MNRIFVVTIFYTIPLLLIVHAFLLRPYRMETEAMAPTIAKGEWVILNHARYGLWLGSWLLFSYDAPQRGDIVAFTLPQHNKEVFIERVVGIEGDTLIVRNGKLWVNNKLTPYAYSAWQNRRFFVPPHHLFVLGENLAHAVDSRLMGFLSLRQIRGKIIGY